MCHAREQMFGTALRGGPSRLAAPNIAIAARAGSAHAASERARITLRFWRGLPPSAFHAHGLFCALSLAWLTHRIQRVRIQDTWGLVFFSRQAGNGQAGEHAFGADGQRATPRLKLQHCCAAVRGEV